MGVFILIHYHGCVCTARGLRARERCTMSTTNSTNPTLSDIQATVAAMAAASTTEATNNSGLIAQTLGASIDLVKLGVYLVKETVATTRDITSIIPVVVREAKAVSGASILMIQSELSGVSVTEQIKINQYLLTLDEETRLQLSTLRKVELLNKAKEWLATV